MKALYRLGLALWFLAKFNPGGFAQSGVITTCVGPGLPVIGEQEPTLAINRPSGVAPDGGGGLYVASWSENRVYKVAADGRVSIIVGTGTSGFSDDGGPATAAQLNRPRRVAVDADGNLYVVDYGNQRIRKVTAAGVINTVAGNGKIGFSGDGGPARAAQLNWPRCVAVDSTGSLYIADTYNQRIRKVTAAGVISTVAGNGTSGFSGDGGPATAAQLSVPSGLAVDVAGNLYIVDFGNQRIRKVTAAGVIGTVAGNGTEGFSGDGGPATAAQLNWPRCVAVDSAGSLYIVDTGNRRIRKVTQATLKAQ